MDYILSKAKIFTNNQFKRADIFVKDGLLFDFYKFPQKRISNGIVIDCNDLFIFPGFVDVHVHLREPGFFYKENIKTGTLAAAHGGYTEICSMPNLNPVPDSIKNLQIQLDIINKDAVINVTPYGSITKGENGTELSDFEKLAPFVCAFSDDGRGVQNDELMEIAMVKAKSLGKLIVAHCEDNTLLNSGYIHDGEYAKLHNHKGICSASEYKQIERDLKLVEKTGCAYHICHISTKESVALIRKAKQSGLNVTCETSPTYLCFNDMDLQEDGRFKMNPPIRSEQDRLALIEGICDGTIDMIATDHAPHSAEEKAKGLEKSLMGVVGLETAFPVLYTKLVKTNIISLEKLIEIMHTNPKKRFKLGQDISENNPADLTVYDLNQSYTINPEDFLSKGRSTPFAGQKVYGKCKMTFKGGKIVWQDNMTEK